MTAQAGAAAHGRIMKGALLGLGVGLFVSAPWGSFSSAEAPGFVLMLPLTTCFVLLGAWFAAVTAFSSEDPPSEH
jgi:hypothetical protein